MAITCTLIPASQRTSRMCSKDGYPDGAHTCAELRGAAGDPLRVCASFWRRAGREWGSTAGDLRRLRHGEMESIQTEIGGAEWETWQENTQINSKTVMVNLREAKSRACGGDGAPAASAATRNGRKPKLRGKGGITGILEFLRASFEHNLQTNFPRLPRNFLGASVRCVVPPKGGKQKAETIGGIHSKIQKR